MIVTANRTCVLLASEDMIPQRVNTHFAGAQRAALSVSKYLGNRRPEAPVEKSLQTSSGKRVKILQCFFFKIWECLVIVKYKSGGVEAGNETSAVTLNFRKEKGYASCTTTKPEKLETVNKTVAALMRALAVFELLSVEIMIADAVDSRLPTEPLIHNNRGVVGLKVSYVDHQAHVDPETKLLKYLEKVNAQQMVQQVNRMLKKVREVD